MEFVYLSDSVKIKRVSEDEKAGVFDIEGLYRGYGVTIGNALRRVLLSSLPGAAITRFKVKGALHEFTTIPGVVEDVVEIGLNLKRVRFRFNVKDKGPQVLTLKVKGEREVLAGDIEGNADVQVQNPDLRIATLSSKTAELDMEITVEKGLGYLTVEAQKLDRLPIGVVALDAFFSPVSRVNFLVENMRVGERTDYNKIRLEIETDGSISPSRALHKAADIVLDHFKKISDLEIKEEEQVEGAKTEKPAKKRAVTVKKKTVKK
ncbi:MAG: DNA-directed RNA polymerase subunit alpha [Candidatus Colwellbacteria bacterium]|nr:DNA-directed RNA polymerase subunit alpha [Candidatus Colwellbacteria bacterium]